eukprot:TRINITY_DN67331_c9_g2_i2.p1 TRINITY_DN67331_c9_g2~~TRINITY_DN67331_c9_g2_i2.p1  ORF type:complete len:352 (-),score=24.40 TRINITY_DN67331_c9_g2_i2:980-2035(-)
MANSTPAYAPPPACYPPPRPAPSDFVKKLGYPLVNAHQEQIPPDHHLGNRPIQGPPPVHPQTPWGPDISKLNAPIDSDPPPVHAHVDHNVPEQGHPQPGAIAPTPIPPFRQQHFNLNPAAVDTQPYPQHNQQPHSHQHSAPAADTITAPEMTPYIPMQGFHTKHQPTAEFQKQQQQAADGPLYVAVQDSNNDDATTVLAPSHHHGHHSNPRPHHHSQPYQQPNQGAPHCPGHHPLRARLSTGTPQGCWSCDICDTYYLLSRGNIPLCCDSCEWDCCVNCLAPQQPAPTQLGTCPSGHKLEYRYSGSFCCDICETTYSTPSQPSLRCSVCDFDDCLQCSPDWIRNQQHGNAR